MANSKFDLKRLFNVEVWVAVVSGGGTGIVSQAYANNGARVYIMGRREDVLNKVVETHASSLLNPRGKLIPLPCDITSKSSVEQAVKQVHSKEDVIDVLVNNSGISRGSTTVEEGDEDAVQLKEDLQSEKVSISIGPTHFFTTVAFIPLLSNATKWKQNHTASVIKNSSMSGITRTSRHHFKNNVSKSVSIDLSNLLAQELRRQAVNVRVNNITPGIFPFEMTTNASDETNKSKIDTPDLAARKVSLPIGLAVMNILFGLELT